MYQVEKTPQGILITGQGNAVVDLDRAREPALVHITGGQAHTILDVRAHQRELPTALLLTSAIGPHEGTYLIGYSKFLHITRFDVRATGSWQIEIRSLAPDIVQARTLNVPGHRQGEEHDVFFLGGAAPGQLSVIRYTDSHMTILVCNRDFQRFELLTNKYARFQNPINLAPDAYAVAVRSRREWDIAISAASEISSVPHEPDEEQ